MKKTTILISSIFFSLVLLSLASALTFVTPTTGQYINGTINFNVTSLINATQCNWSTSANSNFLGVLNASANQKYFNKTFDTSSLTEVASTTLTVNCSNSTTSEAGSITIGVDNTDPTCAYTISTDFTTRQSGLGIAIEDASSDTTTLTYLWNLTNSENKSKTTSTAQNPTFSNGDIDELGEYTVKLTATDSVNKKCNSIKTFLVTGNNGNNEIIVNNSNKISNNVIIIIVLLAFTLIVCIAVAGWYLTQGTKKRR
jgi:hypothetical protein